MGKYIGLKFPVWLLWISVLAAILVLAVGSAYFTTSVRHQKRTAYSLLASVATMKASQIQQWRQETSRDVGELANATGLVSYYQSYLTTKSPEAQNQVMARLQRRQTNWHMTGITLVDAKGAVQISTTQELATIPPQLRSIISTALSQNVVLIEEASAGTIHGVPRLYAVAPIRAPDSKNFIGAAICSIDAKYELYPIIQSWPEKSATAETILVAAQGKTALALHETRFHDREAKGASWAITAESVPSSQAIDGQENVVEGQDYRSHPVLSMTVKIPDTNWYLTAKIDRSEVFGMQSRGVLSTVIIIIGLLLLVVALTLAGWHVMKSDFYKLAYESELQKQAVAQHYRSLIQNAGDIILLSDTDLRIIDANDLAVQTYGYTREQLMRMSLYDLVASDQKDASYARAERLKEVDILAFNSQHRKQNGELMYVEGRARKIDTAGKHYIQLIMRDTSDRVMEQIRLERSELLFMEFMEHAPGMAYVFNQHDEFEYINKALADILGIDATDRTSWKTKSEHPMFPLLFCDEQQQQELARYQTTSSEFQLPDGHHTRHYMISKFVVPQPDGLDWLGGIILDITQNRQAERELQRMNLIYATLSQINEVIFKATDTIGLHQTVCDVAVEYGGASLAWVGSYSERNSTITPLAWSGSPHEYVNIITAPASGMMRDIDPVFAAIKQKKSVFYNNIASGAYSPGETLLFSQKIRSAAAVPIMRDGEVIGVMALYQREADFFREQELQLLDKIGLNISYGLESISKRQQQLQLEDILINSPAVAFRWMNVAGWPVLYVSDNITQLGIDVDHFTKEGYPYSSIIHPDDLRAVEDAFANYIDDPKGIYLNTYRIIDRSEGIRWVEERSWLVIDESDHSQYVMGIVMDITQQKQSEQNQAESDQRYYAVFNNMHTVMLVVDPATGSIIDANPAAVEFYGWPKEQLLAMVMSSINTLPADQQAAAMAMASNRTQNLFRFMHRRANGKTSDVEVYSTPIVVKGKTLLYCIVHDVTDKVTAEEMRQREEQRRIQTSKMETIGQLSSGIAHDFNNLLTVITGFVDIMMEESDESSPLYSEMVEVKNASDKAASLTKQLLAFSRKQTLEKKSVDINKLVTSNKKMISRLIGEDITVEMTLAPGVLTASVDEGQIGQVILNLATNARDAMPHGGKLRIVTDVINITKDDISFGTEASEGKFIKVTIADTGVGMDEATCSRIFEPFYTTKEAGKGTGLGLATCYGIMKQHDGWISVSSTKGVGTEFYLFLPAQGVVQDEIKPVAPPVSLPQGEGHTVLLVEDEIAVRRMSIKVLERFGYVVIACSDGVEALAMYQADPARFNLVLSDVVMPNMDGLALATHIQQINPQQKIILNSGYTDDKVDWSTIEDKNITFLHKPFTVEKLITTVHQVITGD